MKIIFARIGAAFYAVAMLLVCAAPAKAMPIDDKSVILMYYNEEDLVVESATRGKKSLDQTAENVTIVTAEQIRQMNAHSLAEVLNTVTGVQVFLTGGPGSVATSLIQGSDIVHVSVFMDGVPLNNLGNNTTDVGFFPVQNIAKIEIIKGPASSAWGSALGGVVNIITKAGTGDRPGGTVSATYGERSTGDGRFEISGRQDRVGYYLTGGMLRSDGFRDRNDIHGIDGYLKVSYDITNKTSAVASVTSRSVSRGVVVIPEFDRFDDNKMRFQTSSLAVKSKITRDAEWSLAIWQLRQLFDSRSYAVSSGAFVTESRSEDSGYGSSAEISWKHGNHSIIVGADFDSMKLVSHDFAGSRQGIKKSAYFANDTLSFGKLSLIPGVRYDRTDSNGAVTSPSFGMTYRLAGDILFRAYTARGFNIPPLGFTYGNSPTFAANPGLKMERVRSYQSGIEAVFMKQVWMKLSVFRHDVTDKVEPKLLSPPMITVVNTGNERRQGMEVELKTAPLYQVFFTAGAVFMNARNSDSGETIPDIPQRVYDFGLHYDDGTYKALLQGHYIYWNHRSSFFEGKYDAFITDLHTAAKLFERKEQRLEAFGSIHNLFNGSQYAVDVYKNPSRWIEAGIRCTF